MNNFGKVYLMGLGLGALIGAAINSVSTQSKCAKHYKDGYTKGVCDTFGAFRYKKKLEDELNSKTKIHLVK